MTPATALPPWSAGRFGFNTASLRSITCAAVSGRRIPSSFHSPSPRRVNETKRWASRCSRSTRRRSPSDWLRAASARPRAFTWA